MFRANAANVQRRIVPPATKNPASDASWGIRCKDSPASPKNAPKGAKHVLRRIRVMRVIPAMKWSTVNVRRYPAPPENI